MKDMEADTIYCGDCTEVMRRHVPDNSIDLIYADPPFFSNKPYEDSLAEIKYLLSNTKNLAATGTTREASAGLEIPPARREPNVQGKNMPQTKQPPMQKSESKKPSRMGYLALIFLGICALAVAAIAISSPAVRKLILPPLPTTINNQ